MIEFNGELSAKCKKYLLKKEAMVILSVWYVISPGIILSYIIRVLCGIYAVAFLLKIGAFIIFMNMCVRVSV